jgi:glucose/arabinose dehydrogenase
LGIAFDPAFATNRFIYLYYTRAGSPVKNRVSRFTPSATNPDVVEPGSEVIILDNIASDAGNHNGGAIHFGLDGKLYVGVGDGGSFPNNGQSLSTLSGKLLRINSDGSIPSDNPFVGTSGARAEIWATVTDASGLSGRRPQGMSCPGQRL